MNNAQWAVLLVAAALLVVIVVLALRELSILAGDYVDSEVQTEWTYWHDSRTGYWLQLAPPRKRPASPGSWVQVDEDTFYKHLRGDIT